MKMFTILQAWMLSTRQLQSERGAGLAEYALLLVLIAIACVVAITALGTTISGVFDTITGSL